MITPTTTPTMMPMEPLVSTDMGAGGDGEGAGGGGTSATVGGVTTASTAIEMPVTLASMAVALLGLLVALAIIDCTEAAVTVVVWMLTPTMTLPGDMVNSTTDGSTRALAAIALCIWACTLGVNEETSPSSSRVNPTTIIAGGDGGGGGGEQVETGPETSVRVVEEQTEPPGEQTVTPGGHCLYELTYKLPPEEAWLEYTWESTIETVPPSTRTPPPRQFEQYALPALFSLMVHDEMVTVPPETKTPPPEEAPFP